MALRPLPDNALPTALPERPKKQAKVVVPSFKKQQPDFGAVNDENQAPLPPLSSGDATVDYVLSEDLTSLSDPESNIQNLMTGLESKDWTSICESLNTVRRIALFHSDLMIPMLEKVIQVLVKSMKNPRSALCKTSIMAASDMFRAYGDNMLLEGTASDAFNQLLLQLLLKASQDKKFVCEEADKALNTMVASVTPLPLLHSLRAYIAHSNLRVRAKAAISISTCVSKMGPETMKEFGLAALIQMIADSLNDRLPEAREAARSIILSIYQTITEDDEEDTKQELWQNFCEGSLPSKHVQSVTKLIAAKQNADA